MTGNSLLVSMHFFGGPPDFRLRILRRICGRLRPHMDLVATHSRSKTSAGNLDMGYCHWIWNKKNHQTYLPALIKLTFLRKTIHSRNSWKNTTHWCRMELTRTRGQNMMLTKQRLALTWRVCLRSIAMRQVVFSTAQSFWQGRRDMVKPKVSRFFIVRCRPLPTRKTTLQNITVNLFILACSGPTKGLLWITEWDFKAWSAFNWLYVEGSYLVGYDIPPSIAAGVVHHRPTTTGFSL